MQVHSMKSDITTNVLDTIDYLVGDSNIIRAMPQSYAKEPFSEEVLLFLNALSKHLIQNKQAKIYSDVITLGFWLRKSSLQSLSNRFQFQDQKIHMGKGVIFHIAPSNVPVNYMYSLVSGLLTGNANIIRIPSKNFPQISILNQAIIDSLESHPNIRPYICLIRYGHEKNITDYLSSISDSRVIWGGDKTIQVIRSSELQPRSGDITFSDRFSLAIIDADVYIKEENKDKIAEGFYNDTFLTDQNACTSPKLIIWLGEEKSQAKKIFWDLLYDLVKKKYTFQPIMGINKILSAYMIAIKQNEVRVEPRLDNLIFRVNVSKLDNTIIDWSDHSGYFFEYDCDHMMELQTFLHDSRIQTIAYMGNKDEIRLLLTSGIRGVDRVVPIGKTMDFDLIWDGYNLVEEMTRTIDI